MKPLLFVAVILCLSGCESRQEQVFLYDSWCKLNKRHDITIDEWQALRENYMLPGGDAQRASDDAMVAQATASAAMAISVSNSIK